MIEHSHNATREPLRRQAFTECLFLKKLPIQERGPQGAIHVPQGVRGRRQHK